MITHSRVMHRPLFLSLDREGPAFLPRLGQIRRPLAAKLEVCSSLLNRVG